MAKPTQKQKAKPKKSLLELDISLGTTGLVQRALFAKNLSVMLKAGLTIVESLQIAQDSAQGKFKRILKSVLRSVQSGNSLADSLSQYPKVFSGLFINAAYSGESSGTLEENLSNVAKQLEKEKELSAKIKGAMLYPVVVLVAAFVLGLGMAFLVLPKIVPLFEGLKMDLPLSTRFLIWFSHQINDYGLIIFIVLIVFIIFIFWLARTKFIKPITHWLFLKVPIIKKISRAANLSRFCMTLGTLMKSGLNIDEALDITRKTMGNYYYQRALGVVGKSIGKGSKLSDNLAQFQSLFPIMVTRMIKVGEKSGKMEETLLYLANYYEIELENSTKSLTTAIEPVLLIVIGLIVAFLALSIITPIYNITGSVSR